MKEKERERNLIKKMHVQKTKKGQPLMKNYINFLVHKIEKDIKSNK